MPVSGNPGEDSPRESFIGKAVPKGLRVDIRAGQCASSAGNQQPPLAMKIQ